ncbi:MAG TPA: 1-deoxy-D-xylulose-5-phosphate synthase [Spirochaetota bacterium]|nr:1-deoxy-D-xylulose-5-phosphate synthase [Spirochaetota bacterium]HSA15485.1 1-deoxy-D-xylulose-5-phosphate synthase [Spirochaetota bacterium]
MFLEKINSVSDLKKMAPDELGDLAREIRNYIIDVISVNGGHLASSLGVVDLTIALHYTMDTPRDRIIWDVGHQTYAHKILTGRRKDFATVRKHGGISGFPKRKESVYDTYDVGHSSTSLSLALGEAVARDLAGKKHKVVAVIGDGSLTGGMAMEALNQIGHIDNDLIIILNDNEHSISKNVGALSRLLTKMITGSLYNRLRRRSMAIIKKIPVVGMGLYTFIYRFFMNFKGMITPGQFFEDLGIRYFGPVDGHNIGLLNEVLHGIKEIESGPKIIHVITQKGRGYVPAERDPARFHGIGRFDRATGVALGGGSNPSYSEIVGRTLAHIARKDRRIVAVTAAMKLGTGLFEFEKKSPDRFFDVGIAEQHAITFSAAMASAGFKPFVSIYSTFLQRAVDQLIHDVGIMNLPVRLCIDRAGVVGDDGETHHGVFDIALLRNVPNFVFIAPSNATELRDAIYFAAGYDRGPIAIRYPRGGARSPVAVEESGPIELGRSKPLVKGSDVAILALGDMVDIALRCSELLAVKGVSAAVVNIFSIKPLDLAGLGRIISRTRAFVTIENAMVSGGVGESIVAAIPARNREKCLFNAGFPDEFVAHGRVDELFRDYGLDAAALCDRILKALKKSAK